MSKKIASLRSTLPLVIIAALLLTCSAVVFCQTETVLYNFNLANTGVYPNELIFDGAGNLYGTAIGSNAGNCATNGATCGVVFELMPTSNGWQYTVLYTFTGGSDGGSPYAGLVFDSAGNLYGTTYEGGVNNCIRGNVTYGCGVVFKLSPGSQGWTESVSYTFTGGSDGGAPASTLIFDSAGNLYGTTRYGGDATTTNCDNIAYGCGVVFELSLASGGSWTESVIHAFIGGKDGFDPYSGLTSDAAGNLYGTTIYGGNPTSCFGTGCGTIFELAPTSSGWRKSVLHAFAGKDGQYPTNGLVLDGTGHLYGTTTNGGGGAVDVCGIAGCGVAFKLSPPTGDGWKETVLYPFDGGTNGKYPEGNLVFDAAGNLYGTTVQDGATGCEKGHGCGAVFELTPASGGAWTVSTLHDFTMTDGNGPTTGVLLDAAGNLYGTTQGGGKRGDGVVFELSPTAGRK
jgi:uncharacterized repeat protein (TIGR03803 family)